jgi:uncharacterized membrane protein YkoI
MNSNRKPIVAVASLGAVLAGTTLGLFAMNTSANAATTDTSVVSQTSGSTDATAAAPSAKVAETPLTGDDLAKATAAAQTAVPGATIDRAETEGDGSAVYEVHVTRADGTHATVKLNSDFSVNVIEEGKAKGGGNGGPHQANGITETPLTGDELAKATAAANTAAPGSTIDRAETDADGDSFEIHITKADGTRATVKLNADFSVKTVEAGPTGGRGGKGHGGQPPVSTDAAAASTTSTAVSA